MTDKQTKHDLLVSGIRVRAVPEGRESDVGSDVTSGTLTGMSGHGIAMGPGVGLVMSQLLMGETPSVDLHPFRLSRFKERDAADWRKTL